MQTFLPYPDFNMTALCLDYRRLGKQRVEAMQIYCILAEYNSDRPWAKHPAVLMWKGYLEALAVYYNVIRNEWIRRGYRNNMPELGVGKQPLLPNWMGLQKFHLSHQSNLIRKDKGYYQSQFGDVPKDLPYFWPAQNGYVYADKRKFLTFEF